VASLLLRAGVSRRGGLGVRMHLMGAGGLRGRGMGWAAADVAPMESYPEAEGQLGLQRDAVSATFA
jgi:hypothetical protein